MDCQGMKFRLQSGHFMPLIGFGTYQIRGRDLIRDTINYALGAGYRQIDTAAVYHNEEDIGIALKEFLPKYNLKREDIFITSKLSPSDQGEKALNALETSIKKLDCGYLDLYLIHWPGANGIAGEDPNNAKLRTASWASLVQGVQKGIVRDIGVSNYTVRHLNELLANDFGVKPSVNQVEWHPHCHDPELKELCEKEGILLQAYSSLGGTNNPKLISNAVVVDIAQNLNKQPAQVLLRWALQHGIGIIPKARNKERIEANIALNFVIPAVDMERLSHMGTAERYAWNPKTIL